MQSLLITIDALRADHLGQYGYRRNTMPAGDDILESGGVASDGLANGANTAVSLPSLLTSRYRGTATIADGPTVASALQDDVTTAAFHSNALFENSVDAVAGFDIYDSFGIATGDETSLRRRAIDAIKPILVRTGTLTAAATFRERVLPAQHTHTATQYVNAATLTDTVGDWISDHRDDDWFAWAHYMDPHRPYGVDLDDPQYSDAIGNSDMLDLMARAGTKPEGLTDTERRQLIDLYDSDIRYTSSHLERLFDQLKDIGIWDDLTIILTADHGEEFTEHGHFFHRNRPYEELIDVPLIVKPGDLEIDTGGPRELLDIGPTICDAHNVSVPKSFRGTSLSDDRNGPIIARGSIIDETPAVAVRDDSWKCVFSDDGVELYDLETDKDEQYNIADDHPDVIQEFRNNLPDGIRSEDAPQNLDATDDAVEERLADLGYLDSSR